MFATRDQENLINAHQTAAAAKSLNQGGGSLAPKTPGNNAAKTNLNGRSVFRTNGKGDENAFIGGGKADLGRSTFVTPAPKERAPLGAKTTNAKAKAFQTPAPLAAHESATKTQRKSASARKSKLKVHQQVEPVEVELESEEEVPDIEYAPPKITELPDWPDEETLFAPGREFPQLKGSNYSKDWYQLYCNPIGEDGLSKWERESKKADDDIDKMMERHTEKVRKQALEALGIEAESQHKVAVKEAQHKPTLSSSKPLSSIKQQPLKDRNASSTLTSRAAASALSNNSSNTSYRPNFAAPTVAANAKSTTTIGSASGGQSSRRQTPGTAASRTTIGYSKGRSVSSSMRQMPGAPNSAPKHTQKKAKEVDADEALLRDLLKPNDPVDDEEDDFGRGLFGDRFGDKDWFDEQVSKEFVLQMPEMP